MSVYNYLRIIIFRLHRRKGKLLLLLLSITPFILLHASFNQSDQEIEFKRLKFIETKDDSGVDLSSYKKEYDSYSNIKQYFKLHEDSKNRKYKKVFENERKPNQWSGNHFLIYEATKVFGEKRYCSVFDSLYPDKYAIAKQTSNMYAPTCNYKNCLFTCDRKLASQSNAILFHNYDLEKTLYWSSNAYSDLQKDRDLNQVWILWNDEPFKVKNYVDKFRFNWTMSYRYDAEISDCSYGCKYQKKDEQKNPDFKSFIHTEFINRKNRILWFVSNCKSKYRIKLATEISSFYPTQIMGICKHMINFKNKFSIRPNTWLSQITDSLFSAFNLAFSVLPSDCPRDSNCEVDNYMSSKFVLGFESTNCSYYITEKFWRSLRLGLIPVVFQPSKVFYEQIAPTDSFIHAQDFNYDVQKLSEYLKLVSNNFEYYFKHLRWKNDFDVTYTAKENEKRRLCELCTKLNLETSKIEYESVSNWFNRGCIYN